MEDKHKVRLILQNTRPVVVWKDIEVTRGKTKLEEPLQIKGGLERQGNYLNNGQDVNDYRPQNCIGVKLPPDVDVFTVVT